MLKHFRPRIARAWYNGEMLSALHRTRLVRMALLGLATTLLSPPDVGGADLAQTAADLRAKYTADIEQLAKWCEETGLKQEAGKTRHVLLPTDPYKLYVPVLPDEVGPPKLPADAPPRLVEWNERFQKMRQDHAAALYDIAKRSARSSHAGLAVELVMAAIHADPDNESVRRLFGYQKYRDRWQTLYEIKKLRTGNVWSDKFGWLPKGNVRRYEDGLRYNEGRWISAAEDARRHGNIHNGWRVETEHYVIQTNYGIEAVVALGVKFERLNRLWRQMFVGYYASEADVTGLFEGRQKPTASPPRHGVAYFRNRDEYIETLQAEVPDIKISHGMYRPLKRLAYFYPDKESGDRTLYHEATHQLFQESRRVTPNIEQSINSWVLEGIAMYMESLRQEDGYYVLGGFDDPRLHAAQVRLLRDHFYLPLDEFIGYTMDRLHKDPDIGKLYSQAAGLTHFLIHYDGGRYRDALVAYLTIIYSGRDDRNTLAKLTGKSYSDLDREYREFLEAGAKAESGMQKADRKQ
jgi:hypothetical protein